MENDQELIKEVYPISILRESLQNKDEGECWISEDVIKKWTDNPQGVSPEYPYEFCCTRHYTYKNIDNPSEGKEWLPWDTKNISLWAHYGMNAIPYQLLLGNPYESIYLIEASGATREAYVIIDGDGISTGEIILLGGYENKDQKFNLKIDEISILDPINNIERNFKDSNYKTINLGDNWYCRFELSDNNGNPVIKIIGIGPNPESAVTPPSTILLAPTDSCFKCNLGGKYQKKIVIQAKNKLKNITAAATWTVTAIRDKNGDGIWRYLIMPNIDRVVRNVYYKRIGEDDKAVTAVKDVWNIGDANSLKFDLEKDTYGKAWKNIDLSEQKCRIRILGLNDKKEYKELYNEEATTNPATINFKDTQSIFSGVLDGKFLLHPVIAQYTVEMLVEDPDYGEGFSVVDKCNLIFEYIVSESGKDGEDGENGKDGKDGTSSVFNLSNDSGSFAYDYKTGEINLSPNDKTTDIQYIVESNYKCCDSIKIGKTLYEKPGEGSYVSEKLGTVNFKLTKNTEYWTLEITSIITSLYESIFAIPITGVLLGKEVGTATFKMIGIKDLNKDGAVYSYRLVPEHTHSQEHSSDTDYLDVQVYREALIEGPGYNDEIDVVVLIVSKLNKIKPGETEPSETILSTSDVKKVKCGPPAEIHTNVSMYTVQKNHGVIAKVYANDPDYYDYPALSEGSPYHFTGEAEDIPWTAPLGIQGPSVEVDYEELKNSIKTISCSNDNIVVIPGEIYTFTFKDIAGVNILEDIIFGELNSNFFEKVEKVNSGIYKLTAKTDITSDPSVGTITYLADGYPTPGEITYTWVGDANSDGVYYNYDIEPSAQVLGYTEVDGNLAFNIGEITITCKNVKHEGVLKTSTLGSGYILVGSNLILGSNFGELKNGQVTITLGEPPQESTEESKKLYYSKKTSFRVYWFTYDKDYEEAHKKDPDSIPSIEINGTTYYQVDSELINVVPNTAIDATTNLQAYTGSGTFIVDPKTLTATFEYKSDAPGYYLVRFNKALYKSTGDIYFATTTSTPTEPNTTIKISMGPGLMRTSEKNEEVAKCENITGPYGLRDYTEPFKNSEVAWIKCPSVHVSIYKEKFNTLLFEDTVVRTGLDGYYWNVDENGLVSIQSNGDAMTSINLTANSIVSIASGVSPNLCKGAATDKTSPFTWVTGNDGLEVTSYYNSKRITAPNTDCSPIGTGLLVSTSGTLCTYYDSDFKLNEGYYGISLSPNLVTEGGTIAVGYDGPLLYENYSAPSGKAIAISSEYNGKGIKFTAEKALLKSDYILSFYASLTNKGTVYVKANNNTYLFTTTNSVKRYVLKLNNLLSTDVIIYKDSISSTLYISSILFEKGSLVTDWKDYGLDVSTIILEASRIEARVENIEGKQSLIELTADGIKTEVATIKGNLEELKSSIDHTAGEIKAEVAEVNRKYGTLKSYIDAKPTGIDMATVVNGIRTAGINIKNGGTNVTDGEINPNSGSVELTGQVIATNFMVKSGVQDISEFRNNDDIVMCITTWGSAKTLGSNDAITLDDSVPVFIIKSNDKVFILNPLLLNSPNSYSARYLETIVLLYAPITLVSLNSIILNNCVNVYQYLEPSYKSNGGIKEYNIEGAENLKDVMCRDKNYENLAVSPPTFNTNSLLNEFTITKIKEITAPVYINNGSFITFVPMDMYKIIKYTNGKINNEDNDVRIIFIGKRATYDGKLVSLSENKEVLYKLGAIPMISTTEKEFTHKYNAGMKVTLTYTKIADSAIYSNAPIFVTKIGDTEFNYIFENTNYSSEYIETLISNSYSSKNLKQFTETEKNNFSSTYNIGVEYKEFLDYNLISGICNVYGITSSVL